MKKADDKLLCIIGYSHYRHAMKKFLTRITNLNGWRAMLACYLSGAVMALAFAPFNVWLVSFFCLPYFYLLLERAPNARSAMWQSFTFGYGYFMAGTWWIANSMLVDVAKFGWMIPFSVLGLSGALALYFLPFGYLVHKLRSARVWVNIVRFSVLWVAVEYLRSIGIFGFPWNLLGYTMLSSVYLAQAASLVGVFGLSLIVVLAAVSPVFAIMPRSLSLVPPPIGGGVGGGLPQDEDALDGLRIASAPLLASPRWGEGRVCGIVLPILLIGGLYTYGLARVPEKMELTSTHLRIVQPNIPQAIKSSRDGQYQAMRILGELSGAHGVYTPDIVVWPETAYPFSLRDARADMYPPSGLLVTGALRVEGRDETLKIFNSIAAIDAKGAVRATFDKGQLVPFGEFVPLRSVLPLEKITPGSLDFSRGAGPTTIAVDHVPSFSPLVCYEVVFPWLAVDAAHRPAWMVNATNDGWYGETPGPYQHFAMARMRAIEQGLPLVRAANSGISAVVDSYGRVIAMLPLDVRSMIDVPLPAPLEPTVYAKKSEWLTLLIIVFMWLFTYLPQFRQKR